MQLSPNILKILEAMTRVRRPSLTEIAKSAQVSAAAVSRAIAKMRSEGLPLKGLVDYGVVGLKQAIHVYSAPENEAFPDPSLLRWVMEGAVPSINVAATFLPKGAEGEAIKSIESSFTTCETFMVVDWVPPRPEFGRWFRPAATTFIIRWDDILEKAEEPGDRPVKNPLTRYDPLDPLILSVLEKEPFIRGVRIRKVLEEHGVKVRYQRIMAHLRNRIYASGGFAGATLATTPLDADRSFSAVIAIKGSGALPLTRAMLTHPFFYDAYVGERVKRPTDKWVFVRAHIPVTELSNMVRFFIRAGETGYLSKWRIIMGTRAEERAGAPNMKAIAGL